MTSDALAYAKDVWAACATLGFHAADVHRLKAELDRLAAEATPAPDEVARVLDLASEVQRQSVAWAFSRAMP